MCDVETFSAVPHMTGEKSQRPFRTFPKMHPFGSRMHPCCSWKYLTHGHVTYSYQTNLSVSDDNAVYRLVRWLGY